MVCLDLRSAVMMSLPNPMSQCDYPQVLRRSSANLQVRLHSHSHLQQSVISYCPKTRQKEWVRKPFSHDIALAQSHAEGTRYYRPFDGCRLTACMIESRISRPQSLVPPAYRRDGPWLQTLEPSGCPLHPILCKGSGFKARYREYSHLHSRALTCLRSTTWQNH
jgi:hypothetical protein